MEYLKTSVEFDSGSDFATSIKRPGLFWTTPFPRPLVLLLGNGFLGSGCGKGKFMRYRIIVVVFETRFFERISLQSLILVRCKADTMLWYELDRFMAHNLIEPSASLIGESLTKGKNCWSFVRGFHVVLHQSLLVMYMQWFNTPCKVSLLS